MAANIDPRRRGKVRRLERAKEAWDAYVAAEVAYAELAGAGADLTGAGLRAVEAAWDDVGNALDAYITQRDGD